MNGKKNIALIGMPGSGKSTIGILLAKALCMRFVDTDILIQNTEGMRLSEIISSKGSAYFSKVEEEVILGIAGEGMVISTGGSAVLSSKAMNHLKKIAHIIYLETDLWLIKKRLWNFKTRGIVTSPGKTVEDLYRYRRPIYRQYAEIKIRVRRKKPDQIVANIIDRLRERSEENHN
ncbi:MAG: shikimate kinase [Clostridiales bacterium]|nr:shikimate kinase [Clostridiales bacterium]